MKTLLQDIMVEMDENGVGEVFAAADWDSIEAVVVTEDNAALTLKAQATLYQNQIDASTVDFASAQALDNEWYFVALADNDSGSIIAGSTGIVLTGTDICKGYELNINKAQWISFQVSGYSAGTVTVRLRGFQNGSAVRT